MKQRTISKIYSFSGKGLHTGKFAHMQLCPAPVGSGIRFFRTDLPKVEGKEASVAAVAENVSRTARSTTISKGKVSVSTIEHLLSALTGLGVDNAYVRLDGPEVPILDGSAKPFADAIAADGTVEQELDRKWITLDHTIEYIDPDSGSWIKIEPSDTLTYTSTIDFNSHVLGVQTIEWDPSKDYVHGLAPCRTFCFLHEVLGLLLMGLVRGGSLSNAIVIVEKPVSKFKINLLKKIFHQKELEVRPDGYLNNLELHFPDECGRHKMMDLIGDLRLCGGFLKANITAYKPGHKINTKVAQMISNHD